MWSELIAGQGDATSTRAVFCQPQQHEHLHLGSSYTASSALLCKESCLQHTHSISNTLLKGRKTGLQLPPEHLILVLIQV